MVIVVGFVKSRTVPYLYLYSCRWAECQAHGKSILSWMPVSHSSHACTAEGNFIFNATSGFAPEAWSCCFSLLARACRHPELQAPRGSRAAHLGCSYPGIPAAQCSQHTAFDWWRWAGGPSAPPTLAESRWYSASIASLVIEHMLCRLACLYSQSNMCSIKN